MGYYGKSERNFFAANSLDRLWQRRSDSEWIARRYFDSTTRFVPVWQTKNLFTEQSEPQPITLAFEDLEDIIPSAESIVLLGAGNGTVYFAIDLPSNGTQPPTDIVPTGQFRDLKSVGPLLEQGDAALLAYARAVTYWHSRNRYCGVCGSPTQSIEGGHVRVCTDTRCGQQHFPRTDPAIIVLIAHQQHCLLGRQPIWPKKMYSTIAGFVEPGESLEGAVAREAFEETGVQVDNVRYHSSQPWPFPCSIMLGFTAEATGRKIRLGDNELENARWFSRAEIESSLRDGTLRLPTPVSIAYRLIEDWFDDGATGRLKGLLDQLG